MSEPKEQVSAELALEGLLHVDLSAGAPLSQKDGSEPIQLPTRRRNHRFQSTLNESNFDNTTGMPDMEGLSLRARLRAEFNLEAGSPDDFPKAARLLLRKQNRGCVTPEPEPVTEQEELSTALMSSGSIDELPRGALFADGTNPTQSPSPTGDESPGGQKRYINNRRISEPVLALSREILSHHTSSQELQASFWRQWQRDLRHSESSSGLSDGGEEGDVAEQGVELNALVQPDSVEKQETSLPTSLPEEGPGSKVASPSSPKSPALQLREAVREALDELSGDPLSPKSMGGSSQVHDLMTDLCLDPTALWRQPDNVLIVIDWDDTILPTTWLAMRPWFRNWVRGKGSVETALEGADQKDREKLAELDLAARSFIQTACHLGRPFFVTLAQRPWVERSMKAVLPQLAELWETCGLTVSYAEEEVLPTSERSGCWCKKPCKAGQLEDAVFELQKRSDQKRKVMHRLLRRFYKKTDNIWLNVVSFGDGAAERSALQEIAFWHENPPSPESGELLDFRAKSVQLFEEPDCAQLTGQLKVLQEWLPVLVSLDQDLDAVLGVGDDEDVRVANDELLMLAGLRSPRSPKETT